MIKRYGYDELCWDKETKQESVMGERPDGEWVRYEDVKDLLQAQFQTLNIHNGDVLVIEPSEGKKWTAEQSRNYAELARDIFREKYDNVIVLFTGDQKIEIKSGQV